MEQAALLEELRALRRALHQIPELGMEEVETAAFIRKKLEEYGTKRLKDLQNYKSIDVTVDDVDLEIGDIVGGYEEITGTSLQKPVTRKIISMKKGKITIDYEVKGDD